MITQIRELDGGLADTMSNVLPSTDRMRTLLGQPWVAVSALTLGLGATVAVSWFLLGGSVAFRGPIPVFRESWPAIYGFEAVLAAVGLFMFVRLAPPQRPVRLALLIGAAWIGEFAVVFVGGTMFANELVPGVAWFYWILGTGGPIQPLAALAGGLLAIRSS